MNNGKELSENITLPYIGKKQNLSNENTKLNYNFSNNSLSKSFVEQKKYIVLSKERIEKLNQSNNLDG